MAWAPKLDQIVRLVLHPRERNYSTLVNIETGQEKGYLLHVPQLVYVLSPNMRSAWSERNIKKSLCFTALLLGKCQPPVSTYYVTLRFPATLKKAVYAGFIFVSFVWPCLRLIFVSSPKNLAILSLKFDCRGRISFACSINRWICLSQFQSLWKPVNLLFNMGHDFNFCKPLLFLFFALYHLSLLRGQ